MSPGITAHRVYEEIRRRLADGRLQAGARIEPSRLAEDLFASVTPIRDALHRLAGQRLIDTPYHDGFRVPAPTEAALRDLYRWRGRLLALAAGESAKQADACLAQVPPDPETLFLALAQATGSAEHGAAIDLLNARLAPYRAAERAQLDPAGEDARDLHASLLDPPTLRMHLRRYHRRRIKAAPDILSASANLQAQD